MRRALGVLGILGILLALLAPAPQPTIARAPAQAASGRAAPTAWPASWPPRSPLADRLAAPLDGLLRAYRAGGPDAAASYAQTRGLPYGAGDVVRVVLYADSEAVAAELGAELAAVGLALETSHDRRVQGLIPVAALETLAAHPGVRYVRPPLEPLLADSPRIEALPSVVSEGIAVIGADVWQAAGYTGAGVKIAVLDGGFQGYAALLGSELPSTVITHSARADGDLQAGEDHGAACAEIVYDTAPGAELYLVNFNTDVEFANAVDWIRAQGVDIVSCSLGWPIGGPGDGSDSGPIVPSVLDATHDGILWVNSAGNHVNYHWMGAWAETTYAGLPCMAFGPGDATNRIYAEAGDPIRIGLRWDDLWGDVKNDFALALYNESESLIDVEPLPYTEQPDPNRFLSITAPYTGNYDIVIVRVDTNATTPLLELFTYDQELTEYYTPASSILVPADVADALAVGAFQHNLAFMVEPFSSQGPSLDGRLKPDLVGPDGVSSVTYGNYGAPNSGFWGTSAACPHAAGAAALLWSVHSYLDNAGVASRMRAEAQDIEPPPGPDYIAGYGRLQLGSVVTPTFTPTFTPTPTRTPTPTVTDLPTIPPPTWTPTRTATRTITPTPTPTLSPTPGPSPTPTLTTTPSHTPLPTATPTPTLTVTPGPSPTPSDTPTLAPTATLTPTPIPSFTVTPGPSPTASFTPTVTPTPTHTRTPTRTVTPGPSPTPTRTATPYPTATPWPAGWQRLAFSGNVVRDVIIDPHDANRVMICTATGVFLSVNGGTNWSPANTGLTDVNIYQLAQDPGAAWVVYAASEFKLWRSINAGASWQDVTPATVTGRITGLAAAPKHSGRVYLTAASPCGATFVSTDGASSWTRYDGADVCAGHALDSSLQVSAQNADKLYLARGHDRAELYRSTAGGASWTRLANIGDGVGVYDLALDGANDQHLYAATENMGVFTTRDGGGTWNMVGYGLPYSGIGIPVTALALGPTDANIVYCALDNGEVYRTLLGGYWWTRHGEAALPAAVNALRIAPNLPGRIWAATDDGLWTMDTFTVHVPMVMKHRLWNVTPTVTPTRTLTPSRTRTPTITLTPSVTPTPIPTPTNCYEAVKNGGFEAAGNWDIATTPRSARFVGDIVRSGSVALLTGIKTGEANVTSHSSAGQLFMIPVNATSVTLRYYRQRHTEEAPANAELPAIPNGKALARSLLPYDQDWQEVLLLDSYYNVLAFVERGRGNDSGWVERTFDLTSYRGRWVVLYFNTYNDGAGGVSWMFVDDVSVGVCR